MVVVCVMVEARMNMTDFNFLIASYKEDFDKSNTLQSPFVRYEYVYYICTSDVIESRAEMIATYISTHCCISICALQKWHIN